MVPQEYLTSMKKKIPLNTKNGLSPTLTTCYSKASEYNFCGIGGGKEYNTKVVSVLEIYESNTEEVQNRRTEGAASETQR